MKNNNLKKNLKKYLHDIKKSLPLKYKYRRTMIQNLSNGIEEYCSETENVTMDMIYHEFGTVEQVTDSLMNEIPTEQIIKHFRLKHFIIYTLICAVILATGYCVTLRYFIHHMPAKIEIELKEIPNNENK